MLAGGRGKGRFANYPKGGVQLLFSAEEIEEADQVVNDNECHKCNKTFSRKYLLNRHLREVHEEFHCSYCDRRFARKPEFQKHMNRFHKSGKSGKSNKRLRSNQSLQKHVNEGNKRITFHGKYENQ